MRRIQRALVLGGAGFLGGWLVDELAHRGIATVVVDRAGRRPELPAKEVNVLEADVQQLDVGSLVQERDIDAVFQLAGTAFVPASLADPIRDLQLNAEANLRILTQLRELSPVPLLLFVSSAAVYGNGRRMPMDEDHPFDPLSPYGVSKLAAERYLRVFAQLYGMPAVSVRPFSLYGPGQRKLVIYDLLARIHAGENPLVIAAPPELSRDFIFVEDAARMIVQLAEVADARGEAYNLAFGQATSLRELVAALLEVTGIETEVHFTGVLRPGDPPRFFGDPARASALGARCQTSLTAGLRRTNEWFLTQ